MKEIYDYSKVEKKWQNRWFKNQIYKADIRKTKPKFFIHFAYPGVSGYLHVGHMRGFTYADIIARYKRMKGFNVIFPAGFHASGIPSIGFAKKIERGDKNTIDLLIKNGCSTEMIKKLKDPVEVVNYFSKIYVKDYWKRFGFLIDYSRLMSTISDGYKKFITWQFLKLKERNLLIQKPHYAPYCPNCGPVAVDKSETDISKGGSAEILEFTIIKFRLPDGTILPAATLRPETIFGVTNMWVNPEVTYEKIKVGKETWICSKECTTKISYQIENVETLGERIDGKELIGKYCKVPMIDRDVQILGGIFADPSIATGIVMSVPAHAPYDWIALVESNAKIDPIQIIDVKGFGKNPAREICEQMKIESQEDKEKLEKATEILYKKEFHTGVLNNLCGRYAGLRISNIKDTVKNDLIELGEANVMREFSEEVICRCGERVVIKKIPDQWFIKYSDSNLTNRSKDLVNDMNILPEEYKRELPGILDWFDDRACIRRGSWLGTEFPFKKGWIIEPISDSTLYPMYYIISRYINNKELKIKEMDEEFFDYIFLGEGKPKRELWKKIKEDVEYWYPVDINLGGKEHKTVHFPVFIMNHVAILPKKFWPKGIFAHWWVTQKGKEKISKSKGGAEPIPEAAEVYGVDSMRFYYAHIGSPFVDIEWDPERVLNYKNRIIQIWKLIMSLMKVNGEVNENIDRWLFSSITRRIGRTISFFDNYDIRDATNEIFFEIPSDLRWYRKRGGENREIIAEVLERWIRLMTPITPHLAEELWENIGKNEFVSITNYPEYNKNETSPESEVGEHLLREITEDIKEIMEVTRIKPKRVFIYTSPRWKYDVYKEIISAGNNKVDIGNLTKNLMKNIKEEKERKEAIKFIKNAITEIKTISEEDRDRYITNIDEENYLKSSLKFLKKEFNADITIERADKTSYDPTNKSRFAKPLKPAIYIE